MDLAAPWRLCTHSPADHSSGPASFQQSVGWAWPDLPTAALPPTLPEMWKFPQTFRFLSLPSPLLIPLLPCPLSQAGHTEVLAGHLASKPAVQGCPRAGSRLGGWRWLWATSTWAWVGIFMAQKLPMISFFFFPHDFLIKGFEGFCAALWRVFPGGTSGKELSCQCKRHKRYNFDSWVRKIPQRRA